MPLLVEHFHYRLQFLLQILKQFQLLLLLKLSLARLFHSVQKVVDRDLMLSKWTHTINSRRRRMLTLFQGWLRTSKCCWYALLMINLVLTLVSAYSLKGRTRMGSHTYRSGIGNVRVIHAGMVSGKIGSVTSFRDKRWRNLSHRLMCTSGNRLLIV